MSLCFFFLCPKKFIIQAKRKIKKKTIKKRGINFVKKKKYTYQREINNDSNLDYFKQIANGRD